MRFLVKNTKKFTGPSVASLESAPYIVWFSSPTYSNIHSSFLIQKMTKNLMTNFCKVAKFVSCLSITFIVTSIMALILTTVPGTDIIHLFILGKNLVNPNFPRTFLDSYLSMKEGF